MTLPMDSLESFQPNRDEGIEYDPYQGMGLEELRDKLAQVESDVNRLGKAKDSAKKKVEENQLLREMYILREKIEKLEGGDQTLH